MVPVDPLSMGYQTGNLGQWHANCVQAATTTKENLILLSGEENLPKGRNGKKSFLLDSKREHVCITRASLLLHFSTGGNPHHGHVTAECLVEAIKPLKLIIKVNIGSSRFSSCSASRNGLICCANIEGGTMAITPALHLLQINLIFDVDDVNEQICLSRRPWQKAAARADDVLSSAVGSPRVAL